MSEPVDVVAAGREAVERIVCYDALSMQWNGRRDSDIVSELCDEVERLQAENLEVCKNNLAIVAENDRLKAELLMYGYEPAL